jgi:ribosomal protein L23
MFKVQVEGIQTLNVRGKETKRSGRAVGIAQLEEGVRFAQEGQEISFAPGDSK